MKLSASDRGQFRTGAMVILRALQDPRSIPVLTSALDDKWDQVRWNATAALAEMGDAAAIPALIRMLGDRAQPSVADAYDQTPPAYSVAADGLARLGPLAAEALIARLEDENAQIRGAAADILGRIGLRRGGASARSACGTERRLRSRRNRMVNRALDSDCHSSADADCERC